MRRILFLSLIAIGSGAFAQVEGDTFKFLTDLREDVGVARDPQRKKEIYDAKMTKISAQITTYRERADNSKELEKLEERRKALIAEKDLLALMQSDLTGVSDIKKDSWVTADTSSNDPLIKEIAGVSSPAYFARIGTSPFIAVQSKKSDGKIISKVIYFPEGIAQLKEDPKKSFKNSSYKNVEDAEAQKWVAQINEKNEKDQKTLPTKEEFIPGSPTFEHMGSRSGPFSRSGSAIAVLKNRLDDIGDTRTDGRDLKIVEDDIKLAKDDSARSAKLRDLENLRAMVAKVKNGSLNLGTSDEEMCQALIKNAGSYAKMSADLRNECKSFAPAVAKKEEAEDKPVKLAKEEAKKTDAATDERYEKMIRQNMAMCEAMAQRASVPMPDQQRKTLGQIVQKVMTNPQLVCPTFNLVMSNVAAENFDKQVGQSADIGDAIARELGDMEGMDAGQQMEFIGTKAERVVQEYFVAPMTKTTVRGNMREGQLALNAKNENDRNAKLLKEKECLQKMAASMASLMQLNQSLNPANDEEANAVQMIAHYNSLANTLLTSVNKEIQMTNLNGSGVDLNDPPVRRVPLGRGARGTEASSVRVVRPQTRQPAGTFDSQGVSPKKNKAKGIYGQ